MPVSWWIISAAAVVTLFAITAVPVSLLAGLIVAAVAVAVLLTLLLRYGAARVEVDAERLRAGRAVIERAHLGAAEALTGEAARNAFGRDCDPKAYLLLRSYAPGAVRVAINDPSDPTPYWVLATRHPERLAAALSGHSVTRS
ncbi:DUF3093 domain-containing protein [Kribbella sp. NPDC051587]|uniref:DUF3093 domain-containing protein n=1 Tax=Kribbella sp. NPDC051587 TaxID=3364119 RepID=UPI0037BE1923